MKPLRRALAAVALTACLAPSLASGAGYNIYEQGARAMGMAGAATASVQDASAIFYNPAALSRLEKSELQLGATWLTTRTSFAGLDPYPGLGVTEEMEPGMFFPPTLYWANRVGESKLSYGVGVNAPFGLGVEWKSPETFTGRDRITKADLQTINGNLSLAWAFDDRWSVALGANALMAKVELNSIRTQVTTGGQPVNVASVVLEGGFTPGYGPQAAVLFSPNDAWRFGINYRGEIGVTIDDGSADFTQILTGDAAFDGVVAASLPPDQGVSTDLVFPAILTTGIAWTPSPDWTWEIDANLAQWSAFEKLDLKFDDSSLDQTIREDYEDSWQVRFGAEHRMANYQYRFGYYYDEAAAPTESVTPLLPDAPRHGVTLGLGWDRGNWKLDLYNLFLFVENRSTELRERDGYDGVYKSYVNALGASIGFRW